MARGTRGKQPQFSADDLMRLLGALMGSPTQPSTPLKAQGQSAARATAGALQKTNESVANFLSPLTVQEFSRLRSSGPDQGHLASLALYASLVNAGKLPKFVRGARTAYRGTKDLFRDSGMSPNMPKMPAARSNELIRE